jgi:membrane fusion protein (multidrug efflux system)
MASMPKYLRLVLGMCLIVAIGCNKPEQPVADPFTVTTYKVEARDVPISREWVGQLKGSFNVDIRAYTEGLAVRAGQLMFKIDPSAYRSYVNQARGRLAEAQAAHARARQDVARYKPLVQENAISRQEYEAAIALEQATAATVSSAEAALAKAQLDLSYCDVRSPIDGIASIAKLGIGNLVGRGDNTLLATVSKIDPIRVSFALSEQELISYKRSAQAGHAESMPVQLKLADGTAWPHIGRLVVADNAVDESTGTIRVDAEFANPERFLQPGQFGRVIVTTEQRKAAVVIPLRAITELQGQARVAVTKNGVVAYRNVELGARMGAVVVVESGLVAGEQIVIDGLQMIRDGSAVKTKPSSLSIDSLLSSN